MAANTMLKRVTARTQPCFTPFVTGNDYEVLRSSRIVALRPSCNWRTIAMHFLSQPNFSPENVVLDHYELISIDRKSLYKNST